MKFGTKRESVHTAAANEQVAHQHVPGKAYNIADPAIKLVHMVGGGFFNEPKYYDSKRSAHDFYAELMSTGKISSTIVDETGLTEQARAVVETCKAVADSDNPEDLLIVAAWARDPVDGLRLRSTPQIMLAIAAACQTTRPFVPKYATAIMRRADEIRQVFGAYREMFMRATGGHRKHAGSLPHALRKGLALALASQSDAALLKYNGSDRPTFADVLLMVGGAKIGAFLRKRVGHRDRWPLSSAMFEYLVNGKYVEPLTPTLAARRDLFNLEYASEATPELLKAACVTWENVVSHFGSSKQTWEMCIPFMNEMAITRNLRNFEEAGISDESWDTIDAKMDAIEESVQLPFRFFTADREVSSTAAKSLVGRLLEKAVDKLVDLPGVTVVLVDNSGSAVGAAVSKHSSLRVSDCGNMLAAVLARKLGRRAMVGVFGDSLIWVPFSQADSCMRIKQQIDAIAQSGDRSKYKALAITKYLHGRGVGGGTETGLWFALDDITKRKVRVDRIVFLSDLCCYTQGDAGTAMNCGENMEQYFGKGATMQSMVDAYRRSVNPACYAYSINLSGYEQSQLRPGDDRTHLLSGWSEKLVNMIRDLEADQQNQNQPVVERAVPTLDVLREKYRRS